MFARLHQLREEPKAGIAARTANIQNVIANAGAGDFVAGPRGTRVPSAALAATIADLQAEREAFIRSASSGFRAPNATGGPGAFLGADARAAATASVVTQLGALDEQLVQVKAAQVITERRRLTEGIEALNDQVIADEARTLATNQHTAAIGARTGVERAATATAGGRGGPPVTPPDRDWETS